MGNVQGAKYLWLLFALQVNFVVFNHETMHEYFTPGFTYVVFTFFHTLLCLYNIITFVISHLGPALHFFTRFIIIFTKYRNLYWVCLRTFRKVFSVHSLHPSVRCLCFIRVSYSLFVPVGQKHINIKLISDNPVATEQKITAP